MLKFRCKTYSAVSLCNGIHHQLHPNLIRLVRCRIQAACPIKVRRGRTLTCIRGGVFRLDPEIVRNFFYSSVELISPVVFCIFFPINQLSLCQRTDLSDNER
jgi:hypothetical protein